MSQNTINNFIKGNIIRKQTVKKLSQDAEDGDKEKKMEKEEEKCGGQETDHQHPRRL